MNFTNLRSTPCERDIAYNHYTRTHIVVKTVLMMFHFERGLKDKGMYNMAHRKHSNCKDSNKGGLGLVCLRLSFYYMSCWLLFYYCYYFFIKKIPISLAYIIVFFFSFSIFLFFSLFFFLKTIARKLHL